MAKQKGPYTRRIIFSGTRPYMQYAECLKKYYNAVDGPFYDAINFVSAQFEQYILKKSGCS